MATYIFSGDRFSMGVQVSNACDELVKIVGGTHYYGGKYNGHYVHFNWKPKGFEQKFKELDQKLFNESQTK